MRKRTAPVGEVFEGTLCALTMFNITDSMEKRLSGETNSRSASEENFLCLKNTNIHYRVYKIQPLISCIEYSLWETAGGLVG